MFLITRLTLNWRSYRAANAARSVTMTLVDTPNAKIIAELVEQFNLPIEKTVKTLLVKAVKDSKSPLGGSAGSRRSC